MTLASASLPHYPVIHHHSHATYPTVSIIATQSSPPPPSIPHSPPRLRSSRRLSCLCVWPQPTWLPPFLACDPRRQGPPLGSRSKHEATVCTHITSPHSARESTKRGLPPSPLLPLRSCGPTSAPTTHEATSPSQSLKLLTTLDPAPIRPTLLWTTFHLHHVCGISPRLAFSRSCPYLFFTLRDTRSSRRERGGPLEPCWMCGAVPTPILVR